MLKINMLSTADSVDGQGVGSAYLELLKLLKDAPEFEVSVNGKGHRYDIEHAHTVNPSFYFKMGRHSVNVCYVHFLPDTLDGSIKLPKFAFRIFKGYVRKFYRRADEIVVVNPIFIAPLVKLGIKPEDITYIPNFVNREDFHRLSPAEIAEGRKKYGLEDKFTVLGVGQVQTRKGVKDFISVAKAHPELQFIWAGGFSFGAITDGYKELKKIVENPPANVRFLGIVKRSEMNVVYNLSSLLFMPSLAELFPMSILEALDCGKPVLVRDLDLYKEILFEDYLKGNDVKSWSEIIEKLHNDPSYYQAAVDKSAKLEAFYSREHVLSIWKEYYPRVYKKHCRDKGKRIKDPAL